MTRQHQLEDDLQRLRDLNLEGLRAFWKDRFGPPRKLRSPDLLRYMIAWRLQAAVHGGLDHETRRKLEGRGPIEAEGKQFGHGTVLRRQWQGRLIEAIVEEDGFQWDGELYPSLSAVARAATGTRWNGPRFFGLRDEKK